MKKVMILAGIVVVIAQGVYAEAVPGLINYQGKITQADGTTVPDGTSYHISFRLYDVPTGGDAIWGRMYQVAVIKGEFNVILGAEGGTALTAATEDILEAFDGEERYLAITVETDESGQPLDQPEEMLPRQQILSAPFAVKSEYADTAVHATHHAHIIPVGTIFMYYGSSAPEGWLLCNGDSIPDGDTYAALRSLVGSNTPDFRGRAPIGMGQGSGLTNRNLGENLGEEEHTLTIDEMPRHRHSYKDKYQNDQDSDDANDRNVADDSETEASRNTGYAGGDDPHNNMQPSLVVNFIIKY